MAFFGQEVSDDMKRQMVVSLSKVRDEEPSKRPQRDNCENKCLADYVTNNKRKFFQKLNLAVPRGRSQLMKGSSQLSVSFTICPKYLSHQ